MACGGAPSGRSSLASPAGAALPVAFSDLRGIQADLAKRRGRPVFVNFWATWCGPCVEELPALAALSRSDAGRAADFVGISTDAWVTGEGRETEDKVRAFMARANVGYTNWIYRGDQDPLMNAFNLPGPIPYSVLYDARGGVAKTWSGPVTVDDVKKAIERAHSSSPGSGSVRPERRLAVLTRASHGARLRPT